MDTSLLSKLGLRLAAAAAVGATTATLSAGGASAAALKSPVAHVVYDKGVTTMNPADTGVVADNNNNHNNYASVPNKGPRPPLVG